MGKRSVALLTVICARAWVMGGFQGTSLGQTQLRFEFARAASMGLRSGGVERSIEQLGSPRLDPAADAIGFVGRTDGP